ncbi:MAG TPA: aldehyde dehydrogenase family protein [Solirubrobacterales bacterium]|nr:aldehyde dehydrogenase family protein [Solirubrobacterales bacterium]
MTREARRSSIDPAGLRCTVAGKPWDPEGEERIEVVNPATDEVVASVPEAGADGAAVAVAAAAAAFDGWRRTLPRDRGVAMFGLATLIEDRLEELAELESLDVGKPLAAARKELRSAAEKFRLYAGAGRAMTAAAAGEYKPGVTSFVRREPIGVVAALAPWNYPLGVAAWKIAPALMAGNTVVLKPSPETPLSTMLFGQLAAELLPPGVLSVITGGAPTGEALALHPDVGMVSLTGGTSTGRRVMELASRTLKRVHLELGGKAPVVVFDDADLSRVLATIPVAAFDNAGQNCIAASRLYVGAGRRDEVVAALAAAANAIEPQDPWEHPDAVLGSLISRAHRERVHGFVERAGGAGAEVLTGGEIGEGPGAFYPPTVVAGCGQGDEIVQREIFGPVISVLSYEDEREAIEMANGVEYGLTASVWSSNIDRAMRVAREIRAGTVWVNDHGLSVHEMPFGGFKQSGIGRDLSIHGIEEHTELQHVSITAGSA